MFVQALAEYADNHLKDELDDVAFEERAVPYYLSLAADGRFLAAVPRFVQVMPAGGKGKPKQRSQTHRVPRSPVYRNSGLHPMLAVDEIGYVLGHGPWKAQKSANRINKLNNAFIALIRRAARETQDAALTSLCKFYDQPDEVEAARKKMDVEDVNGNSTVALQVGGELVKHNRPAVAEWWRTYYSEKRASNRTTQQFECLVSDDIGQVPLTHLPIKHMTSLGGQSSGVSLMSFDKHAFTSYGWKKNANSPVSENSQSAYVLALNHLLNPYRINPENIFRKDFNDVAFIFWLRWNSRIKPVDLMLERPTNERISTVAKLFDAEYRDPDPNCFYMAALSATGARLVVRSWISETLPVVLYNVQNWWRCIEIQHPKLDQPVYIPSINSMLGIFKRTETKNSKVKDGEPTKADDGDESGKRKKQSKPGLAVALFNRAVMGSKCSLGPDFLAEVLAQIKNEVPKRNDEEKRSKQGDGKEKGKRVPGLRTNPTAMSLVRICLNDDSALSGKGEFMPVSLDENIRNQAYICGRLLATYDRLQYLAFTIAGEAVPNRIVSDRYYHMMMTSATAAISSVSELGTAHLRKLKRCGDRGRSVATSMEQQIAELYTLMGASPPQPFDIFDRARFVFGFYQQTYRPKKTDRAKDVGAPETDTTLVAEDYLEEKESDL